MTTPATKPRKFKAAPPVPEVGRLKSICSGTSEVFKLDPRIIERETGFNSRFDFGDIDALMEEILAAGEILQALLIRKEGSHIFLVDGDRRLTAVMMAIEQGRWPADPNNPSFPLAVPCRSEGKNVSPLDRKFAMLTLNNGKPFSLLEKAFTYRDILALEPTIPDAEIARRTGETKQAVSNALTLIRKAGTALIQLIKDGKLSATTALEIAKTHEDHKDQLAAAKEAIATAKENGREHATPKDLPAKEPAIRKIEAEWKVTEGEDTWKNDIATDGSSVTALHFKWGIKRLEIRYAFHKPTKLWYSSYHFDTKDTGSSDPVTCRDVGNPTADQCILATWPILHRLVKEYATGHKDERTILLYLDVLGSRLQAVTAFGNPATTDDDDDSNQNLMIPGEDEDEDPSDQPDPAESKSKDAPADPSAYDRIKNANSNGGGGGSGESFGLSSAKIEKRLSAVDELFDELNKDACNSDRWDTMELLIDYINGSHTVATLKKHLLK